MNNRQLHRIIQDFTGTVDGGIGHWTLILKDVEMSCISDELHNRMRLIAPITSIKEMKVGQMKKCMEANFHTALDVKYSFSKGQLFGVFIHPLKELTESQFKDGLRQLFSIVKTYDTTYSGGELKYPTENEFKTGLN
jgi:hypothetical protein